MRVLSYIALLFLVTACAKVEQQTIIIETNPEGAKIVIAEKHDKTGLTVDKELGISPVNFIVDHKSALRETQSSYDEDFDTVSEKYTTKLPDPKYIVKASKDGYFTEKKVIVDFDELEETGKFTILLEKSPMWWTTSPSDATNEWVNLTVNSDISDTDMWQRLVAAVTKRYHELSEYDFKSGYLATIYKYKSYSTSRGTFILRSKFIATVMERDPLTYRLTITSEWSNREKKTWRNYPRLLTEDANLVTELMNRFQAF